MEYYYTLHFGIVDERFGGNQDIKVSVYTQDYVNELNENQRNEGEWAEQPGIDVEHDGIKEGVDWNDMYSYAKRTIPIGGLTLEMLC